LLLRYLVVWLAMGLSFAALARALTPYRLDVVPYLVASWAAAYVIGYLSLLTPSGLGVREGILALLLTEIFAAPLPTVIAIVARLWMVLAELLGAGVALVFWRKRKPYAGQWGETFAPDTTLSTSEPERSSAGLRPSATDAEAVRDAEAI
jgi:hypothetical protein